MSFCFKKTCTDLFLEPGLHFFLISIPTYTHILAEKSKLSEYLSINFPNLIQTSTFHEDSGLNWNININLDATITWKQKERNCTHCEPFLPLAIPLFYSQDPKARRMFSLQLLLTIYCSVRLSHTQFTSTKPNENILYPQQ